MFKMSRHSGHFTIFSKTMKRSKDALLMLVFVLLITMVVFAGIIYYLEKVRTATPRPFPLLLPLSCTPRSVHYFL